ncbi:hypothetical protein DJ71_02455, partial [Halorubrum sp. E3]
MFDSLSDPMRSLLSRVAFLIVGALVGTALYALNIGGFLAVALAAGALAVFTVDPPATIYKQAAGALAVFTVDPPATIYKQATGALAV